jgi:hypothetical protein
MALAAALKVNPSDLFRYLDRPQAREDIKRRIRELLEAL